MADRLELGFENVYIVIATFSIRLKLDLKLAKVDPISYIVGYFLWY